VALPPDRRRQLQQLGLRALIKRRFGDDVAAAARPLGFAGGAAMLADGRELALAAVFADTPAALGTAVDLAHREGAHHLYFFAEDNTGDTARRARQFRLPVTVVDPDGDFQALEPGRPQPVAPMPPALAPAAARLAAAGLAAEWEHEVLTGEWLGLEVARALGEGGAALEVGVGRNDRAASRLSHPGGAPDQVLDQAVAVVRDLRRADAPPHPANRLAPERWLRAVVTGRPELVGPAGCPELRTAPPPAPRSDLRQRSIAPAWGVDPEGTAVVVVCSTGIDPDLVPQAADARVQAPGWPGFPAPDGGPVRLVVVVPEGDDHPLTRRLVALLREPGELVTVPADWRRSAG
jgi:hypothetical protein